MNAAPQPIQFPGGTGLLGGGFNPVHLGHLHAARAVCAALGLARTLLVPVAEHPLKRDARARAQMAPASLRFAWLERALKDEPQLFACNIELERAGPSYTVDTLRQLRRRERTPLVFTVGQDSFAELPKWREPEALLTQCHFAVLQRIQHGEEKSAPATLDDVTWMPAEFRAAFEFHADFRAARHRRAGTWVQRLMLPTLDISSTQVRARLAGGHAVDDLLPAAIARAVQASGCYEKLHAEKQVAR